ncbi:MAG TPA: helicase-associated domain-containing protein [Nocardioidaceae bacterium]
MSTSESVPRSLTQMLRERDDAVLVRLLLDRPDLAFPAPTDMSEVASRATTRHSVTEALALLNAFELWVATTVVARSAPFDIVDLSPGTDPTAVHRAVQRLVDLGLVWGHADELTALRPVRAMSALLDQEGSPGPAPAADPPAVSSEHRTPALVDKLAAGSAFELVQRMGVLLEHCGHQPVVLRRDGELTTRELRAFGSLLDVPSATTQVLFDLARRSGLLGLGSDAGHEVLLPTRAFDDWLALSLADQWAVVVDAWFARHHESGPGWLKRLVLAAFGEPGGGNAVPTADVLRWVAWHRPRRAPRSERVVTTMLDQAAWIGVTGIGAVASFALAADRSALAKLLPPLVDHVLIQADLTAVAPGPLLPEAAHDLGTLADVESRGGATVYRLSAESLTRAQGLGWSAAEILATLEKRSRTPLPQALEYLVHDLDRQRRARRGDRAVRAEVAIHLEPERGVAPDVDELTVADRLDARLAEELVATLRGTDEPASHRDGDWDGGEPVFDSPLVTLREAAETGEVVWVGYVDPLGVRSERLVRVGGVEDGLLRAKEAASGDEFSLAVHRITAAHIIRASR